MSPLMRWLSGGLVAALLLAVGVTWYLNRPRWEVFYKANDPAEVTSLSQSLDGLKVQYRVTGDGLTIQVPSSERSAANLAKAQSGLPNSGQVGLEIFNEPKFGATEFDKKVNLKRATEGELARTLMRIADIQYAKVDLVMPEQSVFIRDKQQPSASVMVKPRPGRTLSKENVRAVINYVTGAVEGLTPERVTVINDKAEDLSTGVLQDAGTGMDAEALAQQQNMAKQLRENLLSVLEPMFGSGNVAATVTVQVDRESRRTEETVLGQGVPKSTEVERTGAQSNSTTATPPGNNAGQAPGGTTPPPVYQQQQTGQGASDEYSSKTSTQYDYGKKSQVTVSPAGTPKRITAAITINRQDLTAGMIDQVKQVATSATQAAPEDVAVMAMSFSLPPDAAAQAAAKAAGGLQPTTLAIALGLVSLLLILAFFLVRRRTPEPEPVLVGLGAQPAAGTRLDVALGLGGPDGAAQPGAPAAQAAAASMDGLQPDATGGLDGQKEEAVRNIETIIKKRKRPALVMDEIDNDALADIDVLIDQTPEACAEVIRQWLKGGI